MKVSEITSKRVIDNSGDTSMQTEGIGKYDSVVLELERCDPWNMQFEGSYAA